jgi:hypothetical protein
VSKLASFCAFVWKKRLTRSGDIVGYFCSTSATAPATTAVASEVPLPRKYRASRRPSGWFASTNEFGTRRP